MSSTKNYINSRIFALAIAVGALGAPVVAAAATCSAATPCCTSWRSMGGAYLCTSWKTSSIATSITSSKINGNLEANDKYVRSSVLLPAGSTVLYVCRNGGGNTGYGNQVYPGVTTEDTYIQRFDRILKSNGNYLADKTLSQAYDFDLILENEYLAELGEATCQATNSNWHLGGHAYACNFVGDAKITDDQAGTDILADNSLSCSLPVADCGSGTTRLRVDSQSGAAPATDYVCTVPQ